MHQEIRNKLRNVVTQCRKLLEHSISQELEGKYGIFAKKDQVTADPNAPMAHLTEEEQVARRDILDHLGHIKARGFKSKDALDQLVREIAFTHLNRLCAYKMMEAREVYVGGQKFREAVSRVIKSNGFLFYLGMDGHDADERLYSTGQQELAYRHFLDWLGGLLSGEIGVLFNPNDPANRLYPRQKTLDEVLDLLNCGGIKAEETELREEWPKIWSQDETIGWVYQYFTPKELRDVARDSKQGGSQAPRNSYELAFRNQFFTPRYVVEFLTDNTLGRIWYEMQQGNTKLKNQCRYMVRRPTEIFLKDGEQPPKDAEDGRDDLSQEELHKLPVHIPQRPKKDPRDLKILDPACGSGHFLLYCFDLLLTIYEEAYADPELGPALQKDYPKLEDLRRELPRLILAYNLHGIDIDLRCTQIAALALWLRCQRAYQDIGLKKDRPAIKRSNFVCAERMPGEEPILKEFIAQLEPRLLGQLVQVVFDKMKLAGEAGSLLKIEEEIRSTVAQARKQWLAGPISIQQSLFDEIKPVAQQQPFDFSGITDTQFFEQAEAKAVEALRNYAEKAHNGHRLQHRLFAEDAVRGFAFVDVCHKRFDVVLMNPPFGEAIPSTKDYLFERYSSSKYDLATMFSDRSRSLLHPEGSVGLLANRVIFFGKMTEQWRKDLFIEGGHLHTFVDLGVGVLDDAMVEAVALTFGRSPSAERSFFLKNMVHDHELSSQFDDVSAGGINPNVFAVRLNELQQIPDFPFAYWTPSNWFIPFRTMKKLGEYSLLVKQGMASSDNFRFLRLWWEVTPLKEKWFSYARGGGFGPQWHDIDTVVNWEDSGREIKEFSASIYGTWARQITNTHLFGRRGITYPASRVEFSPRVLPERCVLGNSGPIICFETPPADEPKALFRLLAVLCSSSFRALLNLTTTAGETMSKAYREQAVASMPIPSLDLVGNSAVESVRSLIEMIRDLESYNETCHYFCAWGERKSLNTLIEKIRVTRVALDGLVSVLYGFSGPDYRHAERDFDDGVEHLETYDVGAVSYSVGCLFGRWDIRYATREAQSASLADPFNHLPMCPPGMLQELDGSPAKQTPEGYHLRINWDGILVDDDQHQEDIARRVGEVQELIRKDGRESLEKEACKSFGVKDLRDYLRKPGKGGFWDHHVSRYSKSRRNAPIYWLLQSSKKNYALWLYYHRLDKDLLFKALVNYVEPKIRLETSRLETLRSQKASAGESSKDAKRIAKEVEWQGDFISELRDFEDKVRRAANLHLEPDLNDGVVLNIAPLHELVPWKEATSYWNELLEGKYEWSCIGKQLRRKGLVK